MIIKYYMTWKEVTRILLVYYESRASQYERWKEKKRETFNKIKIKKLGHITGLISM